MSFEFAVLKKKYTRIKLEFLRIKATNKNNGYMNIYAQNVDANGVSCFIIINTKMDKYNMDHNTIYCTHGKWKNGWDKAHGTKWDGGNWEWVVMAGWNEPTYLS